MPTATSGRATTTTSGNKGVRINYVMEFGNFGYKDERSGAGWRDPRPNMEKEVPLQHWHLNDPGVVPNLLQTGAGSPTGICIYEGTLLPEVFRNQIIHCDAGPNVVRAYPVEPSGAGYTSRMENLVVGTRDRWFRPSDVCTAPDGSVLIADWYDPGVGGHGMGDLERGRIFRVVPKGHDKPYASPEGSATERLASPNMDTRFGAYEELLAGGLPAERAVHAAIQDETLSHRARIRNFWLALKMGFEIDGKFWTEHDPGFQIVALRHLRQKHGADSPELLKSVELATGGAFIAWTRWLGKLAENPDRDLPTDSTNLGASSSRVCHRPPVSTGRRGRPPLGKSRSHSLRRQVVP